MLKKLLLVITAASALWAQTPDYGRSMLGPFAIPPKTSLPATCAVGEILFKTNATAGVNIYGCTATNTWTQQGGSASGDMLKSDNLSGLANYTTARSNLGLAIGTNVLAPNGSAASLTSFPKADIMDAMNFCAAAGASGTTYTCNLSPAITAYVTGNHYRFKADVTNTSTAATINFNGVGAKSMVKAHGGVVLIDVGDLRAGQWIDLVYDGSAMQVQSPVAFNTSQMFFGTAAPGSVAMNLRGDLYVDTTNHHVYVCNNPDSVSTPACTSVAAAEWMQIDGGTGGGAPTNAQYLTLATDATLTVERVLTAGSCIGLTDGGAGSTLTIAVSGNCAGYALTAGSNSFGASNDFNSSGTEAAINLIDAAIPSSINGGGLFYHSTLQGHFNGTNVITHVGVAGSGTTEPTAPTSGNCAAFGSGFTLSDTGGGCAVRVSTPGSAGASCTVGQYAATSSFYYACVATNTWVRAALATW